MQEQIHLRVANNQELTVWPNGKAFYWNWKDSPFEIGEIYQRAENVWQAPHQTSEISA